MRYEFRVAGRLGPVVRLAFAELAALVEPEHTVLRGSVTDRLDVSRVLATLRSRRLETTRIRIEQS